MQKLNEYPAPKSVNYEFIRSWHIWKTTNIAALIIDVLENAKIPQKSSPLWVKFNYFTNWNMTAFVYSTGYLV